MKIDFLKSVLFSSLRIRPFGRRLSTHFLIFHLWITNCMSFWDTICTLLTGIRVLPHPKFSTGSFRMLQNNSNARLLTLIGTFREFIPRSWNLIWKICPIIIKFFWGLDLFVMGILQATTMKRITGNQRMNLIEIHYLFDLKMISSQKLLLKR